MYLLPNCRNSEIGLSLSLDHASGMTSQGMSEREIKRCLFQADIEDSPYILLKILFSFLGCQERIEPTECIVPYTINIIIIIININIHRTPFHTTYLNNACNMYWLNILPLLSKDEKWQIKLVGVCVSKPYL